MSQTKLPHLRQLVTTIRQHTNLEAKGLRMFDTGISPPNEMENVDVERAGRLRKSLSELSHRWCLLDRKQLRSMLGMLCVA
jgi:hypothetical protein